MKANRYKAFAFINYTSTEKKNPLKRDQALNDATSGQMGEEPRVVPVDQPGEENKDSRFNWIHSLLNYGPVPFFIKQNYMVI